LHARPEACEHCIANMTKQTDSSSEPSAEIRVRVTPRASRSEVLCREDGAILVRVCTPPVDGQANAAVIGVIAERLRIAKSRVTIVSGSTSREKRLRIDGMTEDEVRAKLAQSQ
jgi:uncharacterized protein